MMTTTKMIFFLEENRFLRTAALSLTLSFLGFTLMLSFFTLSGISTNHTYFERYQDAWDVMAVLADTKLTDFSYTEEIHALADTDSVIYQKADALCSVPADAVSEEVKSLGGLEAIAGSGVGAADGGYTVQAPIVILDDRSFDLYCEQIGVSSAENGSVVLNRIWDSQNSNFRYREYVSFLSENQDTMTLRNQEDAAAAVELPVLGFTQEPPVLREEYDNYALVQFVSLSTWKQLQETLGNAQPDTYIRILSENGRTLTELRAIETELRDVLGRDISFEMENRVQEKIGWGPVRAAGPHRDRQCIFQHAGIYPAEKKRIREIYVHRHDAGGDAENVLDRSARHRGPSRSDHAAGYRCVRVADDNGKQLKPKGIFGGGAHPSCRAFYRSDFRLCGACVLSGRKTDYEMQFGGST